MRPISLVVPMLLVLLGGCLDDCGEARLTGAHWQDAALFTTLGSVQGAILRHPAPSLGSASAEGNITSVTWSPPLLRNERDNFVDFGPGLPQIRIDSSHRVTGSADNRTPASLVEEQFQRFAANLTGRPEDDFADLALAFAQSAAFEGSGAAIRSGTVWSMHDLLSYSVVLPGPLAVDALRNSGPSTAWSFEIRGPVRALHLANGDEATAEPSGQSRMSFASQVPAKDAAARMAADFAGMGLPAPVIEPSGWDYGPVC